MPKTLWIYMYLITPKPQQHESSCDQWIILLNSGSFKNLRTYYSSTNHCCKNTSPDTISVWYWSSMPSRTPKLDSWASIRMSILLKHLIALTHPPSTIIGGVKNPKPLRSGSPTLQLCHRSSFFFSHYLLATVLYGDSWSCYLWLADSYSLF